MESQLHVYRQRHRAQVSLKQRQTTESELTLAHQELWTLAKQIAEFHSSGPLDKTAQLRLKMRQRSYERQKLKIRDLQAQSSSFVPRTAQLPEQKKRARHLSRAGESPDSMAALLNKKLKVGDGGDGSQQHAHMQQHEERQHRVGQGGTGSGAASVS